MSKKGFTLIELLVVIAIIALLLAIILPALNKVKMQAKTVICSVNCRSLSTAWNTYAMENDDKIVSSYTGYSSFFNELSFGPPVDCPNPWIGWAGYTDLSDSTLAKERQLKAIKMGKLYPYLETPKVYRCPASRKYEIIGFTIPDLLGHPDPDGNWTFGGQPTVYQMSEIKSPGSRIVFLDEGYVSFGGYTIYYHEPWWHDVPPVRHNNGITLGYIDGHAEFYKWRDKDTIELGEKADQGVNIGGPPYMDPGNPDLMMMQRGIYGKLGYVPN